MLHAVDACPGRYHTNSVIQDQLLDEIGYTDGWGVVVEAYDRQFTFLYGSKWMDDIDVFGNGDEIVWICTRFDACRCRIQCSDLLIHRVIVAPEELDPEIRELYVQLRLDGMSPREAYETSLLL